VTLTELSSAWNALRNATLGRGAVPLVSNALAQEIGGAYEEWRKYYEEAGINEDLAASVTASAWVERYRSLVEAAHSEGVNVSALPLNPLERAKAAASGGINLLAIALGIGLPIAAVLALRGRR
jgi:hypothetical protein